MGNPTYNSRCSSGTMYKIYVNWSETHRLYDLYCLYELADPTVIELRIL